MLGSKGVEALDRVRPTLAGLAVDAPRRFEYLHYADIRFEAVEVRGAVAENGLPKAGIEEVTYALGIRVLAGRRLKAPGYYGAQLGETDLLKVARLVRAGLRAAYERALANAEQKALTAGRFGPLGRSLWDTELAPIPVMRDTVGPVFSQDPRSVDPARVVAAVVGASKAAAGASPLIRFNLVAAQTGLERQVFVSSEGADIDQLIALTEGFVFVVAQGEESAQEFYETIGHQRGWEVVEAGADDNFLKFPGLADFAVGLAREAAEVSTAPPCPTTEGEVVVVTDPDFNALLCHEVIGHPTELDRALKMETAYAGRSWFFRSFEDNELGRQVASPLVTCFSDPGLPGFGHYAYDDEGTPARRVVLIEQGILRGFMNSRQTAAIVGAEPNGHYKASGAAYVPLIRMSNTVFAPGARDPAAIIGEVDRGYYVVGKRIPSIAESRENFRISARRVYEIRNGRLERLYRNGGITADTKDFLLSIDAVGNDFRLFPIPNCGKGQPMQTKRMGNGGPTLRGRARLTGEAR